jgi:divalent metal cation (Fe/Co/Zn/Cd) transporter
MHVAPRTEQLEHALRLEYFTVGWNLLEAVVGMVAGLIAGSVSLVAFALDSVVESTSGSILIWRLKAETAGKSSDHLERAVLKPLAVAFFALALYVAARAVQALLSGTQPDDSPVGIGLAVVSLIVMPILAHKKKATARQLDSRALEADSTQTNICTYLSAVLLGGLVANSLLGWWWADPLAGLFIAGIAAKEGWELWNGEDICCT